MRKRKKKNVFQIEAAFQDSRNIFELPKGCEYWNAERLKKQVKNGESHEFDGCRYGLKQRYAKKRLPIRETLACHFLEL